MSIANLKGKEYNVSVHNINLDTINGSPYIPGGTKGDKGDSGETGDEGNKGEAGLDGSKGDKGDTIAGQKGDPGNKGDSAYLVDLKAIKVI